MDYLIKNTTREQRINLVKNSLGIVLEELLLQYVNGKKELSEIKKELIERYKS